ncbi:Uncharacterized hydrophobic domain-containing protein [Sphingomonas sp. EC-HK361]|uniref:DUF389 domain-containing protein n=1 Tax=Sphingomonas sp. EC-HK361 TaxID=2038397 RepID=UPI00125A525C|nr:DUF389 domain-containing protein [Sphingomonas sp. EC-HK361]VVS97796.1 Uncharacterized hydrophobic domain-containing protein [Sphingomonas sp. EC-HK361]
MSEVPQHRVLQRWWQAHVIGSVDHVAVIDTVHDDAGWSGRYLFMIAMSAGIAILGLLLSSPAVVIGAMLISPLMGPIIGLGFAVATVDSRQIRRALAALVAGSLIAVLFCAAIVLVSPLQNVTSELAARTRPNLFDLAVALFSALAGSYATIRGRAGTIVGVAIATALMPPLATVGFGLATWNGTVFFGALLLFVTNFVTIALAAAVMARLYGFGQSLSPNQTAVQLIVVIATFAALAVPLGVALRKIAWEGLAGRQARSAVADVFDGKARISQIDIDFNAVPIRIVATVLTPRYRADAERIAAAAFLKDAGRPARVQIEQYRVGTGSGAAENAALQAAQARGTASPADAAADALADRLALVAGVSPDAITIDREHRRARVAAAALPGASLATYRALEQRAAANTPGWEVYLVPPAVPPGAVPFDGESPDAQTIAAAIWGARRLGLGIAVSGPAARANTVVDELTNAGIAASRSGGGSAVTLEWTVAPPAGLTPSSAPLQ